MKQFIQTLTLMVFITLTTQAQIIKTVAGNGNYSYSGDGSLATNAQLDYPSGVALDASGNIYIADYYNQRIRKVNAQTGIITTIAGNGTAGYSGDGSLAINAELNGPYGVALDASGNIYIADANNCRIREVNAQTGIITTIAGNGTAGFSGDGSLATIAALNIPYGVALDASGNIYIADYGNNRIREVNAQTGIITTVAGNGTDTYSGDGSLATNAQLSYPEGVALDSSGNIYIADEGNGRIRKVNAQTGIITTVAGNDNYGYSGDGYLATSTALADPIGVALDASGNIYIADQFNHRIRKVNAQTGIITTIAGNCTAGYSGDGSLATNAELNNPYGVAIDASGNIYIADYYNQRIRKVNAQSGIITTVAGNATAGYSGDGSLATNAELYYPRGIALDASGNIYIADYGNNRIREVFVPMATGIAMLNYSNSLSYAPNPATDQLRITLNQNQTTSSAVVIIISITGQEVLSKVTTPNTASMNLDIHALTPGVYIARVITDSGTQAFKFIKQ